MHSITMYSVAIAALLAGGAAFGDEQPKSVPNDTNSAPDVNQNIVEQLQGKWIVVDHRIWLKDMAAFVEESCVGKIVFDFEDTTYTVTQNIGNAESLADPDELQQFSIDASKTPIWIDHEGSKGILRVEGNTLTISIGMECPTRFDLAEGDKAERYVERLVLNRIKPKGGGQSNAPMPQVSVPKGLQELQGTWTYVGILDRQPLLEEFATEIPDIKIKGDTAIALRKSGKRTKCKISVDDAKQPIGIDISDEQLFSKTAGPQFSPKPIKGVFRIEGDKLTICTKYREYPTDFNLTSIQTPLVFKKRP